MLWLVSCSTCQTNRSRHVTPPTGWCPTVALLTSSSGSVLLPVNQGWQTVSWFWRATGQSGCAFPFRYKKSLCSTTPERSSMQKFEGSRPDRVSKWGQWLQCQFKVADRRVSLCMRAFLRVGKLTCFCFTASLRFYSSIHEQFSEAFTKISCQILQSLCFKGEFLNSEL